MKVLITVVTAAVIGMPAFAQDTTSFETNLLPMPEHVKTSIAELRKFGDRYEKAIAAIESQWSKPLWIDGIDCEDPVEADVQTGT